METSRAVRRPQRLERLPCGRSRASTRRRRTRPYARRRRRSRDRPGAPKPAHAGRPPWPRQTAGLRAAAPATRSKNSAIPSAWPLSHPRVSDSPAAPAAVRPGPPATRAGRPGAPGTRSRPDAPGGRRGPRGSRTARSAARSLLVAPDGLAREPLEIPPLEPLFWQFAARRRPPAGADMRRATRRRSFARPGPISAGKPRPQPRGERLDVDRPLVEVTQRPCRGGTSPAAGSCA